MDLKVILKEKSKKNLPFPDNEENRNCGENVRKEWDCRCRKGLKQKGMKIGKWVSECERLYYVSRTDI
jgi:hypothetical protein